MNYVVVTIMGTVTLGVGVLAFIVSSLMLDRIEALQNTASSNYKLLISVKAYLAANERRSQLNEASDRLAEIEASTVFVTCGGCGKSAATFDGFTPIPHDCDFLKNNGKVA